MITEIVAGATGLTSLATIIWLVHGRISDAHALTTAHISAVDAEGRAERAGYERDTALAALAAEKKRTAALQEVLDDVSKSPIGVGLSDADWRGRLLRITQQWGDAAEVRVPAVGIGALPADTAADAPEAPPMSPIGDVLR